MRYAALLLLLCACSSLSSEEKSQLAQLQQQAKIYWEGNRLSQALGQIDKALELVPDDYTMLTMRGTLLLKISGNSQGTDHRLLDDATETLAKVYATRAAKRHEPALLFDYALALQKQGRRHLGEAIRLDAMSSRGAADDREAKLREAAEEQRIANTQFDEAKGMLEVLIDRGELLRLCHYHLLLVARDRRDEQGVVAHKSEYLKRVAKDQAFAETAIRTTSKPGYEREQKVNLANFRQEELEVRELLANYHYDRGEFTDALTMLDRVLELDPKRSVDYYNRGRVLLNLEREEDAKADFRKFLATTELPPTSDKAIFAATTLTK